MLNFGVEFFVIPSGATSLRSRVYLMDKFNALSL